MTNKEISRKVEDTIKICTTLVSIGGRILNSEDKTEIEFLDKSIDKIVSGQAEILVMGIIAKDLLSELDRNKDIQVSVHEAGYEHGIQIEFQNRCNRTFKKLNKALGVNDGKTKHG